MYITFDKEQKRISINDAVQGDTFFCPICLERLFVKAGTERARHFSHYPKCECNDGWNGQYDMSEWHYEWQNRFPADNQEVVIQWDDIRHRADVLVDRIVAEFQHSPLSAGKFNDRNVFYHNNIGCKVVWLYDMREDYESGQLKEKNDNIFSWSKPRSTFRKYNLRAGAIDLFFQISDDNECILQIHEFYEGFFQIKQRFTKEAFLSYIGLTDGKCLPPLHIDINIDEEYHRFSEKFNIVLNLQQQRAVQAVSGANLMIAVPGSGKTTVMVARMGYMIYCKGIAPENILAITYTKSATNDIKQRFAQKFDKNIADRLNIRTINSLCEQIITRYVQMFNRKNLHNDTEKSSGFPYTYIGERLVVNDGETITQSVAGSGMSFNTVCADYLAVNSLIIFVLADKCSAVRAIQAVFFVLFHICCSPQDIKIALPSNQKGGLSVFFS